LHCLQTDVRFIPESVFEMPWNRCSIQTGPTARLPVESSLDLDRNTCVISADLFERKQFDGLPQRVPRIRKQVKFDVFVSTHDSSLRQLMSVEGIFIHGRRCEMRTRDQRIKSGRCKTRLLLNQLLAALANLQTNVTHGAIYFKNGYSRHNYATVRKRGFTQTKRPL
jgi:hypothetical protein